MPLLEVKNVSMQFQGLLANDNISFALEAGEIVGLIGPNGAGKTTLFSCIAGFYRPTAGAIIFDGHEIGGLRPNKVCKRGIARTFQIVKVLRNMTVIDNVLVGALNRTADMAAARRCADEIIKLTGLWAKRDYLGGSLTIADMKRVEIARALATQPKLLLLDEVMAGLNPSEVQEAVTLLRRIHAQGITLLIVEHVMEAIIPVCQRIVVLDAGQKIMEGMPDEVLNDQRVIKAYLGDRYHATG